MARIFVAEMAPVTLKREVCFSVCNPIAYFSETSRSNPSRQQGNYIAACMSMLHAHVPLAEGEGLSVDDKLHV